MATPTRAAAITAAGNAIAQAYALRDSLPIQEAARIAYTPTGPTLAELEDRIRAQRATQTADAA